MENATQNQPKVVAAYTIVRYDNGRTYVENAEVEGATPLSTEDIFNDIGRVQKQIEKQREDERLAGFVRAAVYDAMNEVLTATANATRVEELEAAQPTMTPPVEE